MPNKCEFLIIGGGVLGLTTAYQLKLKYPNSRIVILEKETDVACHASGLNSGVLHAGIYYGADSKKAKFCLEGSALMKQFCEQENIAVNHCGKLIVAKVSSELPALKTLYKRGVANGANIELVDEKKVGDIEPLAKTCEQALWSPGTASVSPTEVCYKLKEKLKTFGVRFEFGQQVTAIKRNESQVITHRGERFYYGFLYNCAGLYADKLANDFGIKRYQLMPFKGLYLKAKTNALNLKTNIYPVPDASLPFLGVHFTVTSDGATKVGPTAMPAFWRENYKGLKGFSLSEMAEVSKWYASNIFRDNFGFKNLLRKEIKYLLPQLLVREASKLLQHSIKASSFIKLAAGIRAQLYDKDTGQLVSDFVFEQRDNSLHVLNAVSPGFTSSFAVAKHIVDDRIVAGC